MLQTLFQTLLEFILMAVLELLIQNPKTHYDNAIKDAIKESYLGKKEGTS